MFTYLASNTFKTASYLSMRLRTSEADQICRMEWSTIMAPTVTYWTLYYSSLMTVPSTVLLHCTATEGEGVCDSTQTVSVCFNNVRVPGLIAVVNVSLLTFPLTALRDLREG